MLTFSYYPPIAQRGIGLDRLLAEIVAETQQAERSGFDAVFLAEHHQQKADCLTSPLLTAMALAVQTTRIRIGTGILIAPIYHPVHLAEDTAFLDIVSGGRFILGLGAGYQPEDFTAFGVPLTQRMSLLEESVEVIRRCWSEERFSFYGKRFTLHNVAIKPKPVQQPHPPIWLGGGTAEGARRAARCGDAFFIGPTPTLPVVKELAAAYRDVCAKRGVTPHVALMREGWVAESQEQAVAEYGPRLLAIYRYYWRAGAFRDSNEPWLKGVQSAEDITLERLGADRFILGSPQDCVRQIEAWRQEVGIEHLSICFRQHSGPAHDQVIATLKLFGEQVIPAFSGS